MPETDDATARAVDGGQPTTGGATPVPRRRRRLPGRALAAVGLVAVGAVIGSATAVATHSFTDVPDTHPFAEDIEWLAANGISDGYGDGTFHPGEPLSRQAAAAMLRRVAGADPAVDPVAAAGSLDLQRFTAANAEITATSYQGAQTVVPVDVGAPGRYLLLVEAQLHSTHNEVTLSCEMKSTGIVQSATLQADLIDPQYRSWETAMWIVDEGAGPMELACWHSNEVGTGVATVASPAVVAIRLAP